MTTLEKLMALVENYAEAREYGGNADKHSAILESELTRLLTPLSDEQLRPLCKEPWVFEAVKQWAKVIETMHGITESPEVRND